MDDIKINVFLDVTGSTFPIMPTKRKLIPNQTYDAGRTINLWKCSNCPFFGHCDFMNCDNYAKQYHSVSHTINDFKAYYYEFFKAKSNIWDYETIDAVIGSLFPNFPKNFFYQYSTYGGTVQFIKINRGGKEVVLGEISCINKYKIFDVDLNEMQRALVERIAKTLKDIGDWYNEIRVL